MASPSPRPARILALTGLAAAAGCSGPGTPALPPSASPRYVALGPESGIDFVHVSGASEQKHLIEAMGSGVCLLDYDRDGWTDIYLPQSRPVALPPGSEAPQAVLYRNLGAMRFERVPDAAGAGFRGFGMGCCAADTDGDGWTDLYVTARGPNVLYRNRGGRFEDVTAEAGVGDPRWSSSCAWLDADADGQLDLFVTNYLDYDPAREPWCGDRARGIRERCHVDVYPSAPDALFLGTAGGTFRDATRDAGIADRHGKGLGVVASDLDDDGDLDLFVANDTTANQLWINLGGGRFEDQATRRNVALDANGRAQACMGIAAEDFDGNGLVDLFATNFSRETNVLYLQDPGGWFRDATDASRVGMLGYLDLGFGTSPVDFDLDGHRDLLIANGHIHEQIREFDPELSHAQPLRLLRNAGSGRFVDAGQAAGLDGLPPLVGRGTAVGDLDRDGDEDVVVTQSGGPALVLRRDGGPADRSIAVELRGAPPNTGAIGARVTVRSGGTTQRRELRAGSSYQSQDAPELVFGLAGSDAPVRLEVRWPDGRLTTREGIAPSGRLVVTEQGGDAP